MSRCTFGTDNTTRYNLFILEKLEGWAEDSKYVDHDNSYPDQQGVLRRVTELDLKLDLDLSARTSELGPPDQKDATSELQGHEQQEELPINSVRQMFVQQWLEEHHPKGSTCPWIAKKVGLFVINDNVTHFPIDLTRSRSPLLRKFGFAPLANKVTVEDFMIVLGQSTMWRYNHNFLGHLVTTLISAMMWMILLIYTLQFNTGETKDGELSSEDFNDFFFGFFLSQAQNVFGINGFLKWILAFFMLRLTMILVGAWYYDTACFANGATLTCHAREWNENGRQQIKMRNDDEANDLSGVQIEMQSINKRDETTAEEEKQENKTEPEHRTNQQAEKAQENEKQKQEQEQQQHKAPELDLEKVAENISGKGEETSLSEGRNAVVRCAQKQENKTDTENRKDQQPEEPKEKEIQEQEQEHEHEHAEPEHTASTAESEVTEVVAATGEEREVSEVLSEAKTVSEEAAVQSEEALVASVVEGMVVEAMLVSVEGEVAVASDAADVSESRQ